MLGVFFFLYPGIGSQVNLVIGNINNQPNTSSVLQVGLGFCGGVVFALTVCSGTESGAHINPAVTISFVIFKGFPKMKALRYIVAQILGAFLACSLIYAQYKLLIDDATAVMAAAGTLQKLQFTPHGLPGAFAVYLLPGQSLGRAFLNEFVTDVFIGLVIWATVDPTNVFVPPSSAPFVVALAYAVAIWGFGTAGLATNTARDLGARFLVMTVWGIEAAGGRFAAIAALTNIPATIFAAGLYEIFLADSDKALPRASLEHADILMNHRREREERRSDLEKRMDMALPVGTVAFINGRPPEQY